MNRTEEQQPGRQEVCLEKFWQNVDLAIKQHPGQVFELLGRYGNQDLELEGRGVQEIGALWGKLSESTGKLMESEEFKGIIRKGQTRDDFIRKLADFMGGEEGKLDLSELKYIDLKIAGPEAEKSSKGVKDGLRGEELDQNLILINLIGLFRRIDPPALEILRQRPSKKRVEEGLGKKEEEKIEIDPSTPEGERYTTKRLVLVMLGLVATGLCSVPMVLVGTDWWTEEARLDFVSSLWKTLSEIKLLPESWRERFGEWSTVAKNLQEVNIRDRGVKSARNNLESLNQGEWQHDAISQDWLNNLEVQIPLIEAYSSDNQSPVWFKEFISQPKEWYRDDSHKFQEPNLIEIARRWGYGGSDFDGAWSFFQDRVLPLLEDGVFSRAELESLGVDDAVMRLFGPGYEQEIERYYEELETEEEGVGIKEGEMIQSTMAMDWAEELVGNEAERLGFDSIESRGIMATAESVGGENDPELAAIEMARAVGMAETGEVDMSGPELIGKEIKFSPFTFVMAGMVLIRFVRLRRTESLRHEIARLYREGDVQGIFRRLGDLGRAIWLRKIELIKNSYKLTEREKSILNAKKISRRLKNGLSLSRQWVLDLGPMLLDPDNQDIRDLIKVYGPGWFGLVPREHPERGQIMRFFGFGPSEHQAFEKLARHPESVANHLVNYGPDFTAMKTRKVPIARKRVTGRRRIKTARKAGRPTRGKVGTREKVVPVRLYTERNNRIFELYLKK